MAYYFTKFLDMDFEKAISHVTNELKKEGFGVISEIDLKETLKIKIGVDIRKYKILGACNPGFAYKALLAEPHIGAMLPCNVIVQEHEPGKLEVSAVDPVASMMAVKNSQLGTIASDVRQKLEHVIQNL